MESFLNQKTCLWHGSIAQYQLLISTYRTHWYTYIRQHAIWTSSNAQKLWNEKCVKKFFSSACLLDHWIVNTVTAFLRLFYCRCVTEWKERDVGRSHIDFHTDKQAHKHHFNRTGITTHIHTSPYSVQFISPLTKWIIERSKAAIYKNWFVLRIQLVCIHWHAYT